MSGFTKLVPEIVSSSIWNESPETRCVWIAMIATKDRDGNVRGNRMSLARLANVSPEAVDVALERFLQPDPDSNNQELEGRRIEVVPGGWHVVSHSLYRASDYREYEAQRKRKYRENIRKVDGMSGTCPGHVADCSASVSVSVSENQEGDVGGDAVKPSQFGYDPAAAVAWIPCTKPLDGKPECAVCRPQEDPSPGAGWEMAIPQSWCDEWHEVYPRVLIEATLKEIRQRIRDSGRYVKTPRGMRRFLGGWMQREQNGRR